MAKQIGLAEFNESVKGDFRQYATQQNNPYDEMSRSFPQLDHPVRNWLADGMNLAEQLLAAQMRAAKGQPPLTGQELDDLQHQIDDFANTQMRETSLLVPVKEPEMDMTDAITAIGRIYSATKTADSE